MVNIHNNTTYSLWNFETNDPSNEYQLPKHNSENYIDIDFERHLLFIVIKNSQSGIQSLLCSNDEIKEIKKETCKNFNIPIDSEKILRICFDFDNNHILIKTNKKESRQYFLNLYDKKDEIMDSLHLETFSSEELEEDLMAEWILESFESLEHSDKIKFIKNYMRMKKMLFPDDD